MANKILIAVEDHDQIMSTFQVLSSPLAATVTSSVTWHHVCMC